MTRGALITFWTCPETAGGIYSYHFFSSVSKHKSKHHAALEDTPAWLLLLAVYYYIAHTLFSALLGRSHSDFLGEIYLHCSEWSVLQLGWQPVTQPICEIWGLLSSKHCCYYIMSKLFVNGKWWWYFQWRNTFSEAACNSMQRLFRIFSIFVTSYMFVSLLTAERFQTFQIMLTLDYNMQVAYKLDKL